MNEQILQSDIILQHCVKKILKFSEFPPKFRGKFIDKILLFFRENNFKASFLFQFNYFLEKINPPVF